MASRWPCRLSLATFISLSISASVRYSRLRKSALGLRPGATVRFTVFGVTNLRCDFATTFKVPRNVLFV